MNQSKKNIDKSIRIISASKSSDENKRIADFLAENKISPVFADSGKEIIELSSKNHFPLIFVDSEIDDISLKELPEKINSSKKTVKSILIIILHKDNTGLIPEFKKNGYDDFMVKPLDKNLFLSRLENLLKLNKLENTLARAVKYIQSEEKKSPTDLRNISQDIIIQWGRLETLGRLTSGIMHEITTPVQYLTDNLHFLEESFPLILNALNQFSEIIESAKKGKIDENQIETAEKILTESDIEYLINELPQAVKQSLGESRKLQQFFFQFETWQDRLLMKKYLLISIKLLKML